MYSVKVKKELGSRLDAEFYSPDALQAIAKMNRVGVVSTLGDEIVAGYRVVYHGTDSAAHLSDDKKLGFLSPTQISNEGALDFEKIHELPLYYKDQYPKGLAKSGELLIEVKGNVSKVAVVPSDFPKNLMISGSLYKATLSEKVDSRYALAFLKSKQGQLLKNRLTSNTIISYIAKGDLYSIPVLLADYRAQTYIGNKIRQAERLRTCAKQLKAQVNKEIDGLSLPHDKKPEMISSVGSRILVDRLDPRPYRTHCLELISAIKKISNSLLADSVAMSSGCPVSSGDFIEDYDVPLVRIRNIGFDEFIGLDIGVSNTVYQGNIEYSAKSGCIVLGMDGNFRAQFFLDEELPMLINQRVAIFEPKDIRAELLTHWLNRPEGQIQLYQWAVKTTVDHTSLLDLRKMYIPRFNSKKEEELANMLKSARLAIYYSRKLTMSAKLITEALIDGKLTEQQLIDAQKALVSDNNSLDRDILSRITTTGLDGDGDPLFPDLDQLYGLLAQSPQTNEQ